MAIEFLKANEVKTEYTSWFFYGPTRSGKTTAASTFPRPLFIQPTFEESHVTLSDRGDVTIALTSSMEQTDEIFTELEARHAKASKLWAKGDAASLLEAENLFPWETIVFESLTHYCDGIVDDLSKGGRLDMDHQKWGKLTAHLRGIHSRLRAMNVHIVYIALVKDNHDRNGKLVSAEIAFQGAQSMKLPAACGAVVFFERKEGKPQDLFIAHFGKHSVYDAGVRFRKLDGVKQLTPFKWPEVAKRLGW